MPIPSEIREALPRKMAALNLSAIDLCRLAGWSHPQLSGFLSGSRSGMGVETMNKLSTLVVDLEQLSALVGAPIDFGATDKVSELLEKMKSKARIKKNESEFYTGRCLYRHEHRIPYTNCEWIIAGYNYQKMLEESRLLVPYSFLEPAPDIYPAPEWAFD